jgi:hypothetical protein
LAPLDQDCQPIHPGPLYIVTKAGCQKSHPLGIQNQPKEGSEFQPPQ